MSDVTIVWTDAGLEPTPPDTLRTTLINKVSAITTDYTVLPAGLIEDISSTIVGAISILDADLVTQANSVTPLGANAYYLTTLGTIFGVPRGTSSYTSVYVTFTGPAGFAVNKGFLVSDGTYQYYVVDGGIIQSGGTSSPLYCIATTSGTWSVPVGTVTALATSVPSTITLSCTNATAGTPGSEDDEAWDVYRTRILEAQYSPSQGCASYLKARLKTVSGVQPRLVSVQQKDAGWEVVCGGGDPYAIAYEIFMSQFDPTLLVGSSTTSRNITASVIDYPDTYDYIFVNPTSEVVTMTLTWNTSTTNAISSDSVASLAKTALSTYINSVYVGKPLNIYDMEDAFRNSISALIPPSLITSIEFVVYIDGVQTSPSGGIISGSSESYFTATTTGITVTRG